MLQRTLAASTSTFFRDEPKFEKAGFPIKQAQDMAAAQAEAFAEWQNQQQLATRDDIQKLEAATRLEMQKLEERMNNRFAEVNQRFAEVNGRFAEVNQRIVEKGSEIIKWVVAMGFAEAGFLFGVLKYHG